jgi:hypothetical protein
MGVLSTIFIVLGAIFALLVLGAVVLCCSVIIWCIRQDYKADKKRTLEERDRQIKEEEHRRRYWTKHFESNDRY